MRFLIALSAMALAAPSSASSPYPAIANPGFEETAPGNDAPGWGWYARAQASFRSSADNPHSGSRCLVFTNASSLAPEVYGRLYQGVAVSACTDYELSVWVRGEDVDPGIHFTDWDSYMLDLPSGTYGWQKISVVFRTKNGQTGLNLGINVVNKCKELAIDDVSLRPVGIPLKGNGVSGELLLPGRVDGDNKDSYLAVTLTSSSAATLMATITAGQEKLFEKTAEVKPGGNSFDWQWNSGTVVTRNLDCKLSVRGSSGELLLVKRKIEKASPAVIVADIDRVEERVKELDKLLAACKARGIPVDYPASARTMLAQFIPLARGDARAAPNAVSNRSDGDRRPQLHRQPCGFQGPTQPRAGFLLRVRPFRAGAKGHPALPRLRGQHHTD